MKMGLSYADLAFCSSADFMFIKNSKNLEEELSQMRLVNRIQ